MAKILSAAVLLSSILALSGCAGLVPGLEALGSLGGAYPSYGGGQAYPYDPGQGGVYVQPVQPYYQPYAYTGSPDVYYQQVPQATQGCNPAPSDRWIDRRQQHQQDRIHQGRLSGQLTPREARRLHNEQAYIRGAEGRMRADGNLSPQERARLNAMQNRSGQDINRLRHNGIQPGPTVQPRPAGPGRPMAQMRPAAQPQAPQPRAAAQPRPNGGRPVRHGSSAP